ncbi:glutamate--cysteine ligase [Streptomyces polychromogenes]|uniref:Putative glutamate--cysteine ligase 2 n=1 Tax=Streptomyces polychromogenes TaxID=67342 RepID=A0ABN0VRW9_9ACTN
MRTVGVEEELLLVDPRTGEPLALSAAVMSAASREGNGKDGPAAGALESELKCEQVEFATRPVLGMGELAEEIVRWRAEAARHAADAGGALAALATSPLPVTPSTMPGERYGWVSRQFGLTAREQLTCGCHVHVSVASDDEGVGVLDRIRPWLPVLTALSANSPFWQGQDSEYAGYRSRVWNRLPSAGPTELFGSAENYHRQVRDMIATGVLRDTGMIYFDARLSATYPTVEIRVADVCLEPGTPVLLAALCRALVETAARERRAGRPPAPVGVGMLRLAAWRAARSGLDGPLLDPRDMSPAAPEAVLDVLVEHVRDALDDHGDLDLVREGLAHLLAHGNGARIQRRLLRTTGDLGAMVAECARLTVARTL